MSHEVISFNWSAFLGPFHVVMLHFPIGFFAMAVILEVWASRRPSDGAHHAVRFTLGLSVVMAWLVAFLGYLRSARAEYDPQVVYWHTVFGLTFAALTTATWLLYRHSYPHPERVNLRRSYRGLLGLSTVCLVAAAHGGGTLTHGSKFLTEGAPPVFHDFFEIIEAAPIPSAAKAADSYNEKIRPVLEKNCYSCHGAEKQRGKLRLDLRDAALKGGASGEPAIIPGDPLKSRLVVAMLLPPDHDDVMPPSGKGVLTSEEILAMIRWIQSGASFGETVP